MRTKKRELGFTMIELMVAVGIFAIMAAIAIPGFSVWLPNYRLKHAARDMFSNFQLAKLTAIRRGSNCTITFNQAIGGTVYDYVVYVDSDNDLEYDAGEVVITKVLWTNYKGVTDNGLTFANNDDGLPSIAFRSNGLPRNNAGGFGIGTVSLINEKNKITKVVVSSVGNIRIQ